MAGADAAFDAMDLNGDGLVDRVEFEAAALTRKISHISTMVRERRPGQYIERLRLTSYAPDRTGSRQQGRRTPRHSSPPSGQPVQPEPTVLGRSAHSCQRKLRGSRVRQAARRKASRPAQVAVQAARVPQRVGRAIKCSNYSRDTQ